MNPLCECGCGEPVSKPGNRFVHGHHWRGQSNPNWRGGPIEVCCAFCGQTILRVKSVVEKNTRGFFCSGACHAQWQSDNLSGRNSAVWQGGAIQVACAFCGEAILRKKDQVENRIHGSFCTKACFAHWQSENKSGSNSTMWQGGPIEVSCTFCGETITRTKHGVEAFSNHFCNMVCHGRWRSQNQIGPNHPNWQGGKSFEPYGPEFNDTLKLMIRERDGFTCQLCGVPENGKAYHCHHIDYNKENNDPDNFNALCNSCHPRTNINRPFWTNLFQAQVKLEEWRIA